MTHWFRLNHSLRRKSGKVSDARELEREIVRTRVFQYVGVGYDQRRLELLPGGRVGGGRAALEQTWQLVTEGHEPWLVIAGRDGVTCRLRSDRGVWRGQWVIHERMPVELVPLGTHAGLGEIESPGAAGEIPDPAHPIDAVYLWVDGQAPDFQACLRHWARESGLPPDAPQAAARRFRDYGELKYSLRSLEAHAPWVRRVHLVTNGQIPSWLDPSHPRLSIVHHADIFPDPRHLPTFNSHAIELHLHRIPGLASDYIYLNDDIFLGSRVAPSDFRGPDGVPRMHLEAWHLPIDPERGSELDRALAYTQTLLNAAFGRRYLRPAIAHVRSSSAQSWWLRCSGGGRTR